MKKTIILGILVILTSCNTDRKDSVAFLRERYPNDSIMSTGESEFYVVDSVCIKKITFSRWNAKKIADIRVLLNEDHR